jgi:biopolymer transport protein ExbD
MASKLSTDDDAIVDINITPFVDIVLVILIIFMVTATTIAKQALLVELPDAASGETAKDTSLGIQLDGEGRLYLDGEAISESGLRVRIREERGRVEAEGGKVVALIAADQALAYGRVMRVMDLVKQEGVARFALNIESVPAPPEAAGARPPLVEP